ncbi:HD domain-containing phosphohydrolase [Salinicola lusitanus]|uniref:HD domain-containing phosphohydrolase n=1 Tax=Salinicola lusitanus TaxID=1949085 RepID=UPI000DA22693|nr:HD domain-containing phosphohydrolase [Salinicola lusitanus]
MSDSASTDIHQAKAKWEWLEPLCLQGGVNLAFNHAGSASWPVLLDDVTVDEALVIDVSAVPALADPLEKGDSFHLVGHVMGALVRTSPLAVMERLEDTSRVRFRCTYPDYLSTIHRRGTFRAPLRAEMGVGTRLTLAEGAPVVDADLCNLSLGGCLLSMRLADAVALTPDQPIFSLELHFPNQQRLELKGHVRHIRTNDEWTRALVGCEFDELPIDSERMLWFCVKEIEREDARRAQSSEKPLEPSGLFLTPSGRRLPQPPSGIAAEKPAATVGNTVARQLQRVADYLNAQSLQLQNGGTISSTLLSRHADTIIALGGPGRESLLYAMGYLDAEPVAVQHALVVAIRAVDLARQQGFDSETLKAVAASALVHDLGKASLPSDLLESRDGLTEAQRALLPGHVHRISERVADCRWLSPEIAAQVVGQVNERLDGSGYPLGLHGAAIGELGRMIAVVDVIDALTRPRADRAAWSLVEAYRHVLGEATAFDNRWARRYVRLFGVTPVGSLARYSSGALAWVQRLDAQARPSQVHMVLNANSPRRRLDLVLAQRDLDQLGRLEGAVQPATYGLSLANSGLRSAVRE